MTVCPGTSGEQCHDVGLIKPTQVVLENSKVKTPGRNLDRGVDVQHNLTKCVLCPLLCDVELGNDAKAVYN